MNSGHKLVVAVAALAAFSLGGCQKPASADNTPAPAADNSASNAAPGPSAADNSADNAAAPGPNAVENDADNNATNATNGGSQSDNNPH